MFQARINISWTELDQTPNVEFILPKEFRSIIGMKIEKECWKWFIIFFMTQCAEGGFIAI